MLGAGTRACVRSALRQRVLRVGELSEKDVAARARAPAGVEGGRRRVRDGPSLSLPLSDGGDYVAMIRFGWRSAASTSLSLIRHDEAPSSAPALALGRDRGLTGGRDSIVFWITLQNCQGQSDGCLPAWKGSPRSSVEPKHG